MVVLFTICFGLKLNHNTMKDIVTIDKVEYERLKEEYEKALALGKDIFVFDKQVLLVSYAKYLIEYLEIKFNN